VIEEHQLEFRYLPLKLGKDIWKTGGQDQMQILTKSQVISPRFWMILSEIKSITMSKQPFSFSDDLSFEEKDKFWQIIYTQVSKAITKKHDYTVIFQIDDKEVGGEGYSIIIEKQNFDLFLKNFLIWSEQLERYEICSEVKKQIQKLKKWNSKTTN
jgi:hypothetical protein